MSKVIRLSDYDLKTIEDYRDIMIQQMKVLAEDFPNMQQQVNEYENKDVVDLVKDMLSSALFWNEKNLKDMKN